MRSDIIFTNLTFNELSVRLCAYIRGRINSGEFTERALARRFQISQPHFHNMLKGVRRLNAEYADQIMSKFEITILDLIADEEICNYLNERNPNWLTEAAKRKPPVKSSHREADDRAPWRRADGSS